MEPWARELIDTWNKNSLALGKALKESVEQDPRVVGQYKLEDLEQMMRGWSSMMEEELEGRGTDIRDAYLQSVIPGILSLGDSLDRLMFFVVLMGHRSHMEILLLVSEANRKAISEYLMGWFSRYASGVVQVGVETVTAGLAK